jgi:hypothetical protein
MGRTGSWILIACLAAGITGCPHHVPRPTGPTACPDGIDDDAFRTSLFKLYKHALAPNGVMPLSATELDAAAVTVRCGVPKYAEFWRRIALARLAARSTTEQITYDAERLLVRDPDPDELLPQLLNALSTLSDRTDRFIAAYHIVVPFTSTTLPGMPNCQHTAPGTSTNAQDWLATGNTFTWLATPVWSAAVPIDPQTWSLGCAKLVFPDTHIAKHLFGGKAFDLDLNQNVCMAKPGPGHPYGSSWQDDLYEKFTPLTYADSFIKNILSITTTMNPMVIPPVPPVPPLPLPLWVYHLHYGLELSLQGQVDGAPAIPCETMALYRDDGDIYATTSGSGTYVTATKNVMFSNAFSNHTPQDLAKSAATGLYVMLDALPYMVCCPTFP